MSAPSLSRHDLGAEESQLAALIYALVEQAIEDRIGRAISKATGGVRADAIEGILPPRTGGTGTNTGFTPHQIDTHTNVQITDPQPGQVLVYFDDGFWRNVDFDAAADPMLLTIGGAALTIGGETLTIG